MTRPNQATKVDPLSVRCPKCKADRWDPCVSLHPRKNIHGDVYDSPARPHRERRELAINRSI